MIKTLLTATVACAAIVAPASAQDITLAVGDKAPQLESVEWIKGEPVSQFQEGEIYVLDFWATWCGPCIASIPHINKLQQTYKDDNVNVIGVAIWNSQNNEEFVEEQGDKMDYRIAVDIDDKTSEAYMRASGQGGIPTVMLVDRQGEIAWIGHPMGGLDIALEMMVKDEFSVEKMDEIMAEIEAANQEAGVAYQAGDWAGFEKALNRVAELNASSLPNLAPYIYVAKAKQGKAEEARKYAADIVSTVLKDDAMALNGMAWTMVGDGSPLTEEEQDSELAVTVAERAAELTDHEDADILDTLARAYFVDERLEEAVEAQTKAVELSDGRDDFKMRLEQYQEAANQG